MHYLITCVFLLLLTHSTAFGDQKAQVEQVASVAGVQTTRLVLSARRCVFRSMLKAKPNPESEEHPKQVWDKLIEVNASQLAKLGVHAMPCEAKAVRIASICLSSIDGVLNIPIVCGSRFQHIVMADDELTLGYDPPEKPGTVGHTRQLVESELQRLKIEADVQIHGLLNMNRHCATDCYLSVFCKESLQSEQLEKVAEAVYVVARESMMQAGLQRVAVTNKAAIWKVTAERPAAGSAQTSMPNRQVPAAAEPSEYR